MKKIHLWMLSSILGTCGWALECSSPPITLSEQKGTQWAARTTMNLQGAATVVWVKSQGQDTYILQAATRPNDGSPWTSAQSISDIMNIHTYFPAVTLDGTCTVIWSSWDKNKTLQHYYSKKEGASPWTPTRAIDYPELTTIEDATVDFHGDPLILASKPKEFGVYSYHYKPNEKPSQPFTELPKLPNSGKENAFVPQMLKNKQGQLAALWINEKKISDWKYKHIKTDYQFLFAKYQNKDKWDTSPTPIDTLNFNDFEKDKVRDISASLNKDLNLAILWSYFDYSSKKHKLKSTIKSSIGIKSEEIKDSQVEFTDIAILMDDDGNTVAVWIQPFKEQNVVYAAFKPKEKETWQGVPLELSNITNKAKNVQLGYCNGVFVAVWEEADSMTFKRSIFGTTLQPKPEKFAWTPAVQLSPANQNCWYPSIAFNEKGGIITWTTHVKRTTDYQIQVANLTVP